LPACKIAQTFFDAHNIHVYIIYIRSRGKT